MFFITFTKDFRLFIQKEIKAQFYYCLCYFAPDER
jgi:hypothetical protein